MLSDLSEPLYVASLREKKASIHLDFLRSLAALQVFISHIRTQFFVDYQDISSPSIALKVLYFSTGLGAESVIIFFVLSGLLISCSVLRAKRKGNFTWKHYLINRLSRLYIVLLPALLLTFFWDSLGLAIFGSGDDSVYGGKLLEASRVTYHISDKIDLVTFLGNLSFLNGILVNEFGSNEPVWSLTYEFWYYMLFPCLVLFLAKDKEGKKSRIFHLIIFLVIFASVGTKIRGYFLIWLMGALIALAKPSAFLRNRLPLFIATSAAWLFMLISLLIARFDFVNMTISDFLVGIASTVLIYVLLHDVSSSYKEEIYKKFACKVSDFSYTLYLVHLPIVAFIRACFIRDVRWQPDAVHLILMAAICAFVLAYAYVIAQLTEAKTGQFRNAILSWLGSKSAA